MLAIDVLHTKDGTDYIIEINDTAFGLMYEHEKEDANYIKEEVLDQMDHLFMIK
jgi:glutathione synthase/RimK-type ligase-like ATP-grasp enzyme